MMCFPLCLYSPAIHFTAQLSDSEPPDVKKISDGFASSVPAIVFLAFSNACLDVSPYPYIVDAFPNFSSRYGSIASFTSSDIFVVAALSK